jgi:glycosyltransferase involved in cell wall biosynthesis
MSRSYDPRNEPLVSVITPSYQQGAFIRETIESIVSQDYPNTELSWWTGVPRTRR